MADDAKYPDSDRPAEQPEPVPAPIGSVLSAARDARGLSIADVAAATKLRPSLVQAIENDDFEAGGGPFYARAHLRVIAKVVDADAEELVAEFDRAHGDTGVAELIEPGGPSPALAPAAVRRPAPPWAAAAVAVLVVLVVLLIGRAVFGNSGHDSAPKADPPASSSSAAPTTPAPTHPTPTPKPTPKSTPTPKPTPKPNAFVSLVVAVHGGQSWLQVKSSAGTIVYAGELPDGASMRFTDKTMLTAVFGNVRVVTVRVNGAPSAPPCQQSVCTVQVNRVGSSLSG